jgi:hypothetical protein
MRSPLSWLPAAALLLAPACVHRVDPDEVRLGRKPAEAYYPLAVGNRWTYRARLLGEERVQEVRVLRKEGGYFVDSAGGMLAADPWGVRDDKRYLLKNPVETGSSWTNVVSVSSVERYQVVSTGGGCEVPAGVFADCVQVEGRNAVDGSTTLVNELTFAAGVGLVRIRVEAEQKGGRRIPQTLVELGSYELKGQAP